MLLIYTGQGKGKTSACVGQALRALGQGLRVGFGQFMKHDGLAGEQTMLSQMLGENFLASGAGFYRNPAEFARHRAAAQTLLAWAAERLAAGLDMLILDEALYALGHELISQDEVQCLVDQCCAARTHLVLSGRGAPDWLVQQADIVSEINVVRHIFAQGGTACKGIEF